MTDSFISIPSLTLGSPMVTDRTSDLNTVVINNDGPSGHHGIHVVSSDLAREWAAAFTEAAALLDAIEPPKFCATCGHELPGHAKYCPLQTGGAK
jgi:hypothetical protein